MKTTKKTRKKTVLKEAVLIDKGDLKELMIQIKPFIKKSGFTFSSTEGKWFDSNSVFQRPSKTARKGAFLQAKTN